MGRQVTFTIDGAPHPKARPRVVRRHGKLIAIDPDENKIHAQHVQLVARRLFNAPLEGPIKLSVIAVFQIPKSWTKAEKAAAQGAFHTSRPDFDNLEKAISDALNGIAFKDDGQVAVTSFAKFWGQSAFTRVTVEALT